jgi:hypothetical protein
MGFFSWLFGRTGAVSPDEAAHPDEADGPRGRGVAHLARGEYTEAAAAFREALVARPDDPDLRRALATCCRALGDDAAAADEADRGRKIVRRAAEWWTRFRGQALPVVWEGDCIGHFTPGHADDYPRVKGRWTSSGSRRAGRFEGILLRPDYVTRPAPLRVRLGAGVGGEFLVSGVSVVLGPAGGQQAILLDLTVVTPPDGGECSGEPPSA